MKIPFEKHILKREKKPPLNKKSVTKGYTEEQWSKALWKRKILILTINFHMPVSKQGGVNNARNQDQNWLEHTYLNCECSRKSCSRSQGEGGWKGDTEKAYLYIRKSKESSVIAMVTPTKLGFSDLSKMEPFSFKLRQLKIDSLLPTPHIYHKPWIISHM